MDYAAEAERHRHLAEEFRTMSELTPHQVLRPIYRDVAEVYERLADNEARVARILRITH